MIRFIRSSLIIFSLIINGCSVKKDPSHREVVHIFNEAWNTGKYELLETAVHQDYLKREGNLEINGIKSLVEYIKNYRESYVNIKINYLEELYSAEKAAVNFEIEGTPKKSGRKFKAEGIVIFQFKNGKIIGDHSVFDQVSALSQQGYKLEPQELNKQRILFDTDANNELDDQHALAYLLFSGNDFDVEGITVNKTKNGGDIDSHYNEAKRILQLCGIDQKINIFKGASGSFDEIKKDIKNPNFDGADAVNFIISKAKESNNRKLILLPVGKLTNIALALLREPSIMDNIRIVWLGSNYPESGEYNQEDDPTALQYILDSKVNFEIVLVRYDRPSGTDAVKAYLKDIRTIMPGLGPKITKPVIGRDGIEYLNFGDYSVSLFEKIEDFDDGYDQGYNQARALFDMAAVAIIKNSSWAIATEIASPFLKQSKWIERPQNDRKIIIWHDFNKDEIMKNFYYTMKNHVLVSNSN